MVDSDGEVTSSPFNGEVLGSSIIIQDFIGRVDVVRVVMGDFKHLEVPNKVCKLNQDYSIIGSVGISSQFGNQVIGPVGSTSAPVSCLDFPIPGVSELDEIIVYTSRGHFDLLDESILMATD